MAQPRSHSRRRPRAGRGRRQRETLTVGDAVRSAVRALVGRVPHPALDAELLLACVVGRPKEYLLTHPEAAVSAATAHVFRALIKRRGVGEPLAYLTGSREFFGLSFAVDRRVLIPRPETELLVEEVLRLVNQHPDWRTVADIGTGSGCIAVCLARFVPRLSVFAIDRSVAALSVARTNARRHRVSGRIRFHRGSFLRPLANQPLDLIVSNPPYLSSAEARRRELRFEPRAALVGTLEVYRSLFEEARRHRPHALIIEIDPRSATTVRSLARSTLPAYTATTKKDLAGRERVVILSRT